MFCTIVSTKKHNATKMAFTMRETCTAQISIFDSYSQHEFGFFLEQLSNLLDEHTEILDLLERDFIDADAQAQGRKGFSVESIFRCLLLKKLSGVSYEMLAFHLSDSLSYRTFARLGREETPGKSALQANIRRITSQTLKAVYEALAVKEHEEGAINLEMLRIDSTVVKSNIAKPLDSQLLDDGVRVLSRYLAKSRECTGVKIRFKDYRKTSRSLAGRIFYAKKAEKDELYEELLPLAKQVSKQAERAIIQVQAQNRSEEQEWIDEVEHYRNLIERNIDQAERRILNGEKVSSSEKIVSLFEEHTDIIIKGSRDIDYGHKINVV